MKARTSTPSGAVPTLAIFGCGAVVMYLATRPGMRTLIDHLGLRGDLAWFAAGGSVFLALLVTAVLLLRRELGGVAMRKLADRLRLRPMRRADLHVTAQALALIFLSVGLVHFALSHLFSGFSPNPPFLTMQALEPGERWVLLWWLPMFVLNIMGEEILWHGCLLPLNERRYGRWGWVLNATGWALFHVPFGIWIFLMSVPIVFIETWAIQRTRNTWVGVVIHALVNGPTFVVLSLGYLG